MTIPKTIHHIAPADKSCWHSIWEKCYPTWRDHFSDFERGDADNSVKINYT
jgi:hypothetical protein